jgi:filamentous hemagglutinin family protein
VIDLKGGGILKEILAIAIIVPSLRSPFAFRGVPMSVLRFHYLLPSALCLLPSICLLPVTCLLPSSAIAQITPDGSVGTSVSQTGLDFTITGGTRPSNGPNLFHSFNQFSVPMGGSATFNNAADVVNIFGRVTGGNVSNIDGILRANGAANLFLINPAGIIFEPNASLNIGGSFVGITANTIKFADGTEFNVSSSASSTLLTVSVPVGLQMNNNSGAIQVQGNGHTLTAQHPLFAPYIPTGLHSGLAVPPGRTLAVVGSNIELDGGILMAPEGRVELGSVTQGQVRLTDTTSRLTLNYADVSSFGDVNLKQRSLVDVNGMDAGSIQVQGRNVSLTDGSVLWVQNRGLQAAGAIQVNATQALEVQGSTPDAFISSSIWNETVAPGSGGNIQLTAPRILIAEGASVSAKTYSSAQGGQIILNTTNLEVLGYKPQLPEIFSAIGTFTLGQGSAENIAIATQQMTLHAGGFVGSGTLNAGQAGDVNVYADAIALSGATPALIPSLIASSTLGRGGNSGNLTINTRILSLANSGLVSTSSIGTGSAGNLVINASEAIDIGGRYSPDVYVSAISSAVSFPSLGYAQAFNLTGTPIGSAGNIVVRTPQLRLWDAATINTTNEAIGNAGTVQIVANSILLDRDANITAFTRDGEGGNVEIQAQSLILRRSSQISATAGGLGNGGNVSINASIIVGFENSDIIANAVKGRGGNIQITAQGIFGLKFRPELTPENDITASSQFGVNGTVQISTPGIDPDSGLVELKLDLVDSSQQIVTGCGGNTGSSFVVTGRGGIPVNPGQEVIPI